MLEPEDMPPTINGVSYDPCQNLNLTQNLNQNQSLNQDLSDNLPDEDLSELMEQFKKAEIETRAHPSTEQSIADMFINLMGGGSNYWAEDKDGVSYDMREAIDYEDHFFEGPIKKQQTVIAEEYYQYSTKADSDDDDLTLENVMNKLETVQQSVHSLDQMTQDIYERTLSGQDIITAMDDSISFIFTRTEKTEKDVVGLGRMMDNRTQILREDIVKLQEGQKEINRKLDEVLKYMRREFDRDDSD